MDFDWTTFTLEVINFLVLVWLLKRFLYRPVLSIIEQRRATVQKTLSDAEAARDEARRLQQDYEARDSAWQQEREQRRRDLDTDLAAERERQMQALADELDAERERHQVLQQREAAAQRLKLERQATTQATRFAARLLQGLSGPELDQHLFDMVLDTLAEAGAAKQQVLHEALTAAETITVTSARPLDDTSRRQLRDALTALLAPSTLPALQFASDSGLLAGLRLDAGAWEFDASIAGELRAFAEAAGHA